jgi:ribosomal protein S18 acetylase RimI-like enzyme
LATDVSVRTASPDDVEGIQSVGVLTWPPTYLPFTSPEYVVQNLYRWWSAESVLRSIEQATTLVLLVDGRICGVSVLGSYDGAPVIWKIYVLPELHGRGLGARLMKATLGAAAAGEDVLIELVDGNQRAETFYRAFGFESDHEEDGELGTRTIWLRRPGRLGVPA